MSLLYSPRLSAFHWLDHGFATRAADGWTQASDRAASRVFAHQTHSAIVVRAHRAGDQGEADAIISNSPGLLLEVRTADCVSILLADPVRRAVAAIHAGWKGTAANITRAAIERMRDEFGTDARDVSAAIGPSIGVCCFEVGPEVAEQFGREGRTYIDLRAVVRGQLVDAGVAGTNIDDLAACTKCDGERFHSFRRDRERAGRMASAIGVREGC